MESQKKILENIETEQAAQGYLGRNDFQEIKENFNNIKSRDKKFFDSVFMILRKIKKIL